MPFVFSARVGMGSVRNKTPSISRKNDNIALFSGKIARGKGQKRKYENEIKDGKEWRNSPQLRCRSSIHFFQLTRLDLISLSSMIVAKRSYKIENWTINVPKKNKNLQSNKHQIA